MGCEQLLNFNVVQKFILCYSKNLTCLLFSHKTAFDAQAFLGYLLSAHVLILVRFGLVLLLPPIVVHFLEALLLGQRPNIAYLAVILGHLIVFVLIRFDLVLGA